MILLLPCSPNGFQCLGVQCCPGSSGGQDCPGGSGMLHPRWHNDAEQPKVEHQS